jgi:hypothetical protein
LAISSKFVADEGIDLIGLEKSRRKDDVTQKYWREFRKSEGVLYVGKAQEKARDMRTERRRARTIIAPLFWRTRIMHDQLSLGTTLYVEVAGKTVCRRSLS